MVMTTVVSPPADVEVGTEVEAEPPSTRPARSWRFLYVVGLAVLVGFGLRVAIGLTDGAPPTDETAFLRSGLSIVNNHGFDRTPGRPETHFPPFVPFLIGVASKLFNDPHAGTVAVTCLASTALIVPLALAARQAAGPVAGMVTAWVAAIGPGLSTTFVTAGNGSEAVYTLMLVAGVWYVISASSREGWARRWRLAASGLCVGLAFLTRPEGLILAVPLALAAAVPEFRAPTEGLSRLRALASRVAGGVPSVAVFALPLILCVVPYLMFLHSNTGKWEVSAKAQDVSIEAWRAVANGDRHGRDQELYRLDGSGLELPKERTSLQGLAKQHPRAYAGIVGANVRMLAQTVFVAEPGELAVWALLPAPLWILVGLGAWRLRASRTVRLLLVVAALPLATALAFFVLTRYLVVVVAPATVFVGIAVASLPHRRRRPVLAGTMALLAVSTIFAFHGGSGWWHPPDHTAQRHAGEWIATHTAPGDRIMTRSMVVEYYGQRSAVALPYGDYDQILNFARHYGVRYLVLDPSTYRRLRPQLAFLMKVDFWPGLRLVHDARGEEGKVRIFALDPVPPPDAPMGPSLGFVGDSA